MVPRPAHFSYGPRLRCAPQDNRNSADGAHAPSGGGEEFVAPLILIALYDVSPIQATFDFPVHGVGCQIEAVGPPHHPIVDLRTS